MSVRKFYSCIYYIIVLFAGQALCSFQRGFHNARVLVRAVGQRVAEHVRGFAFARAFLDVFAILDIGADNDCVVVRTAT